MNVGASAVLVAGPRLLNALSDRQRDDPNFVYNPLQVGDLVAATVVRAWSDTYANLKLHLDANQDMWFTSVNLHSEFQTTCPPDSFCIV